MDYKADITQIAAAVRESIIQEHGDVQGMCLAASILLKRALSKMGYSSDVIAGTFYVDQPDPMASDEYEEDEVDGHNAVHYWVLASGIIVDVTASQFNDELDGYELPDVYVGSYEDCSNYSPVNVFSTSFLEEERILAEFEMDARQWKDKQCLKQILKNLRRLA
jgi:hypothetical protein